MNIEPIIVDAVAVVSSDFRRTVEFYQILGFEFEEFKLEDQHIEAIRKDGGARLMIDKVELAENLWGEVPQPANHSTFAVKYNTVEGLDKVAMNLDQAGFKVVKHPWNASWGQRYCVVQDPDGYKIDLFTDLNK